MDDHAGVCLPDTDIYSVGELKQWLVQVRCVAFISLSFFRDHQQLGLVPKVFFPPENFLDCWRYVYRPGS